MNIQSINCFQGIKNSDRSKRGIQARHNFPTYKNDLGMQQVSLLVVTVTGFSFYQELLKEKSNPRLKGNRKGIIVKDKEFYIGYLYLTLFPQDN